MRTAIRLLAPVGLVWVVALVTGTACTSSAATPTPTPPSPIELHDRAAEAVRGLDTVEFILSHEVGGTEMGGGLVLKTVDGVAAFPDRATLTAQAVVTALSVNVEIAITQIGPQAFLRDPLSRVWREVEQASLPFLFVDMSTSVADAIASGTNVTLVGPAVLDEVPVYVLTSEVLPEALQGLVPAAQAGERLLVEVQMGQEDGLVRSLRLEGKLIADDPPDMVRYLRLSNFNAPVTIEPPE